MKSMQCQGHSVRAGIHCCGGIKESSSPVPLLRHGSRARGFLAPHELGGHDGDTRQTRIQAAFGGLADRQDRQHAQALRHFEHGAGVIILLQHLAFRPERGVAQGRGGLGDAVLDAPEPLEYLSVPHQDVARLLRSLFTLHDQGRPRPCRTPFSRTSPRPPCLRRTSSSSSGHITAVLEGVVSLSSLRPQPHPPPPMSRGQRTLSSASSRRFRLEPISHMAEKF